MSLSPLFGDHEINCYLNFGLVIIIFLCMMGFILFLSCMFFSLSQPYLLGLIFLIRLLFCSFYISFINSFIGLILFIIYVGGTIVLFTYCLMLSPHIILLGLKKFYAFLFLTVPVFFTYNWSSSLFEFYWLRDILSCVGVLLFIVILRVVDLIDFSRGSLRCER